MYEKLENIETDFIEIHNLIMSLDNALEYAECELSEFGHLHSLSNIIRRKSEDVFEKMSDLSCEASALQSEKNSRH